MSIKTAAAVVAIIVVTFYLTPSAHAAASSSVCARPESPQLYGTTCGETVQISTSEGQTRAHGQRNVTVLDVVTDRFQRHGWCGDWVVPVGGSVGDGSVSWQGQIPACVVPYELMDGFCADGVTPLAPLWVSRVVDPEVPTFGPWQMVSSYECPEDPLPAAIHQAWRQMTITPQPVDILPNHGWAIATMGVKADLDDTAQTSTVTVLGTSVVLRATPTDHAWSVTDVVTGDSWPGVFETGTHGEEVIMIERRQHRVRLGLTTTWEGHYSLNGGSTWVSAPGTATTTSEPTSVHVYNPRARLVNCDIGGNCVNNSTSTNPFTLTDPDADGIDNHTIPDDEIAAYLKARTK